MKKILISVDEDILEILEKEENRSAYIRKAILAERDNNLGREVRQLALLTDGLVNDMAYLIKKVDAIKQLAPIRVDSARTDDSFVPRPPDPKTGYPCCQNKLKPCKHWNFDGVNSFWTNELTGETREL